MAATAGLLLAEPSTAVRAPAVDVVIPVYNEAHGLALSIRRLHRYLTERFPFDWVVTIADNASTDATWSIACRLADELPGVRAIHLDAKGRGRALRAAWSSSDARVVAYMDVDLSTDLDALLPLVAPLLSGHSDVAIGTRLAPAARVVRGPKREAISRTYNLILRTMLRARFSDAQCGFKAVRADAARELLPLVEDEGWFFDTELLVLAEHNGLRIHEVPVDWVDDPDSSVDVVRTATDDLKGVVRVLGRIWRGRASMPRGSVRRGPAEPGLGSQLVRFVSVGLASTAVFAVLFALLLGPIGAVGAAVAAMAVCALANTAANRRLTFALQGHLDRRRHLAGGVALGLLPLALVLSGLGVLAAAGITSASAQVVVATVASASGSLARFLGMRWLVFGRAVAGPRRVQQVLRYAGVSTIATVTSLVVLGLLVGTDAMSAGWANVVATLAGVAPSFELNRRWVWGKLGRRSLLAEVVPFVAMSLVRLGLSTAAVSAAAHLADTHGVGAGARTLVVLAANVAAFGSLWVAQFVVLDRVLFRPKPVAVGEG